MRNTLDNMFQSTIKFCWNFDELLLSKRVLSKYRFMDRKPKPWQLMPLLSRSTAIWGFDSKLIFMKLNITQIETGTNYN